MSMQNISFVINTSVNTLSHLKLLIKSLKDNLLYDKHEILIFVDSDNEGTVDYLKSIKKDFYDLKVITHSLKPCIGYSRNNNLLVEMASHDIVSYLQSDMVISRNYDANILEDLEDNCILSSTRIEPPLHGTSDKTITYDFGITPENFKYDEFLKFADLVKSDKTVEYFFAPFTFYKHVWLDFGGYDTLFRRSREDSDLLQRFIRGGIKTKQTFKANVYHFSCVASRGKNWFDESNESAKNRAHLQHRADVIELRRFFRKWGGFSHQKSEDIGKYDCDLVITNVNTECLTDIINIEPMFSKVWLDSEKILSEIKSLLSREHDLANELLNFTEEDWKFAKKFYNQSDYESIYNLGEPDDWNAKVEVDSKKIKNLISNLKWISEIIKTTGPGRYELENYGVIIDIKNAVPIGGSAELRVQNPPFDMTLLKIE